jgi:hypothetical protein
LMKLKEPTKNSKQEMQDIHYLQPWKPWNFQRRRIFLADGNNIWIASQKPLVYIELKQENYRSKILSFRSHLFACLLTCPVGEILCAS